MTCSVGWISRVSSIAILAVCAASQQGFAWGRLGHQMVGEVAADLSTSGKEFWQANRIALGELANVPDSVWKTEGGAAEKNTHWFHADAYVTNPAKIPALFLDYLKSVAQYSEPVIVENGTAPWRSEQMYQLAVASFKKGDFVRGLQVTGALAHYIGDLSQPLHVSKNYDGQLSGSEGIHKYFESTNLELGSASALWQDAENKASTALARPEISSSFQGVFLNGVYASVQRSALKLNAILTNDKQLGRSGKGAVAQRELAVEQIGDGAATLSLVLNKIWAASGQKDVAQVVNVQDPRWVKPEYGGVSSRAPSAERLEAMVGPEDCDLVR